MIMPINSTMSKHINKQNLKFFIILQIQIIKNKEVVSCKNLQYGNLRLIKNMNSASCLSVNTYFFTCECYFQLYCMNVRFVNKGKIFFIEPKFLQIQVFIFLCNLLLKNFNLSRSKFIIIQQYVPYFTQLQSLFLIDRSTKPFIIEVIFDDKIFGLSKPFLSDKLIDQSFNEPLIIAYYQIYEKQLICSHLIIEVLVYHLINHIVIFIRIKLKILYQCLTFLQVVPTLPFYAFIDEQLHQIKSNVLLLFEDIRDLASIRVSHSNFNNFIKTHCIIQIKMEDQRQNLILFHFIALVKFIYHIYCFFFKVHYILLTISLDELLADGYELFGDMRIDLVDEVEQLSQLLKLGFTFSLCHLQFTQYLQKPYKTDPI